MQTRNRTQGGSGRPVALGAGLYRCAQCGGPLYAQIAPNPDAGKYICIRRNNGQPCTARTFKPAVAHTALIAELCRLRGAPWTPQAVQRLMGDDRDGAEVAAGIRRSLDQERERMRRHVRRMSEQDLDPTAEELTAFREVGAEISARIKVLEVRLAETSSHATQLPDLRALHDRLTGAEIADVAGTLYAQGDMEGLRALALELIESVRLVERLPQFHPVWGRAEVTWTQDVRTLLEAGLLTLAAPPVPPVLPTSAELRRARQRRYDTKRRAKVPGNAE